MSVYQAYEMLKAEWIKNNPNANHKKYELAMIAIARKVGL